MSSNMGWLTKRLAVVSLSILCLTPPTTAVPLTTSDESITVARSAAALTDQLRILPLGASITRGEQSNPKDGYRKSLRDKLLQAGWVNINMVGSQTNDHDTPPGSMLNGAHEGHSGAIINEVYNYLDASIHRMPNFVLINAGTNDCKQNIDIPNAHLRLDAILTKLWNSWNETTVILSTLLPNADSGANANVDIVNENIRSMVRDHYTNGGRPVFLADMSSMITVDDLADGTHPNNQGYQKMAAVWFEAMQRAFDTGRWAPAPKTSFPDHGTSSTCDKKFGSGKGPVQTQKGSGDDDGPYVHKSQDKRVIFTRVIATSAVTQDDNFDYFIRGTSFANIINQPPGTLNAVSANLDDLILYIDRNETTTGKAIIAVSANLGNGIFDTEFVYIDVQDGPACLQRGLHWGDLDGNGLDDYICIDPNGVMYGSLNQGGNPPQFTPARQFFVPPSGSKQDHVLLADIDGDGRLDYCLTGDNGDISCWRNGGQGDSHKWLPLGVIFTGKGKGDIHGTRFADMNGDFKSDWVWLDDQGAADIYINRRGVGKGGAPNWLRAVAPPQGMGVAGARDGIRFGRIWQNTGASYIWVFITISSATDGLRVFQLNVHAWRNQGSGGTMVKGDGDRYAKVTGSQRDDYIWVGPTGELRIYENTNSPPTWGQPPASLFLQLPYERSSIPEHRGLGFARFSSKVRADATYVDNDGAVHWARNNGDANNERSFGAFNEIASSSWCSTAWGIGPMDRGVQFADLDGDGFDDILCVAPDGLTTAWLTTYSSRTNDISLSDMGQVKKPEGGERANVRWADVNGDGKADYILLDRLTGDATVWYNRGPVATRLSGSSFKFDPAGVVYEGATRADNLYFPDLDGDGRADMQAIDPIANTANVWYNTCASSQGDGQNDADTTSDLPPEYDARPQDTETWNGSPQDLCLPPQLGLLTSNVLDDDGNYLEVFEFEDDCYIPEQDSTYDPNSPAAHDELRRFIGDIHGNSERSGDSPDERHVFVERGPGRAPTVCGPQEDQRRRLKSAAYPDVGILKNAGRFIFTVVRDNACHGNYETVIDFVLRTGRGFKYIAEHMLEQQTVTKWLTGVLQGIKPGINAVLSTGTIPWSIVAPGGLIDATWQALGVDSPNGPADLMGSIWKVIGTTDPEDFGNLAVCDSKVNAFKALLVGGKSPVGALRWKGLNHFERLGELYDLLAVQDYLNADAVSGAIEATTNKIADIIGVFQDAARAAGQPLPIDLRQSWVEYNQALWADVQRKAVGFINDKVNDELTNFWNDPSKITEENRAYAATAVAQLNALRNGGWTLNYAWLWGPNGPQTAVKFTNGTHPVNQTRS